MTAFSPVRDHPGRLSRLGGTALDAAFGIGLTLLPVTSLIALGWITRHMGSRSRHAFGMVEEAPGWILGPHEQGSIARALGGLGANIRAGLMTLSALLVWTLPFSLLWLGAWWAGWENSFNKGYEQAAVGPAVFLLGTLVSVLVLPALPVMLAHMACENRLASAFELRRLRSVLAQAGWRLPVLSGLTFVLALPLFASHGVIALGHEFFPGIEDLSPAQVADLRGRIDLATATWAFLSLWFLRNLAARLYAFGAPRAAGLRPGLWDGAIAAEAAVPAGRKSRLMAFVWYVLAAVFSLGIGAELLIAQFLDQAWWRWVTHPFFALPWAG